MNAHRQELATVRQAMEFANIAVGALAANPTREREHAERVARSVWGSCHEAARLLLTQTWTPDIGDIVDELAKLADLARDGMQ